METRPPTNLSRDDAQRVKCSIDALTRDDLRELIVKLTDYANFLIRNQINWMPRGVLPRGYDGATLALEAIARVLDGRRRDWNPEKEPTLLDYLKSVVKSIFSSEIVPAAIRELPEVFATDEEEHGSERISSTATRPDKLLSVDDLQEQILARFDRDDDQLVLMCIFDEITDPASIAIQTGLAQHEIYRIKQKIKRTLEDLRKEV
jgi:hypothetical protein